MALDVAPGPLAHAEHARRDHALEDDADVGQDDQGGDRMRSAVVVVVHAVHDEGEDPHEHVDDRVDEDEAELALDGILALTEDGVHEGLVVGVGEAEGDLVVGDGGGGSDHGGAARGLGVLAGGEVGGGGFGARAEVGRSEGGEAVVAEGVEDVLGVDGEVGGDGLRGSSAGGVGSWGRGLSG